MEIIEDRHSKRSSIIPSQWPISDWHEIIGEQTLANAILHLIVHSAHRMDLLGPALREKLSGKQKQRLELH
jgi:DNA replication protein DnaC